MRIIALLGLTFTLASSLCASDVHYLVTNPLSMEKVQPNAADAGPEATKLHISMAKGEYEPAQVVVTARTQTLKGVRVSAGKLTGPNGAVIPKERVAVNPIAYVHCSVVSPGAALKGEVADVMLSDRRMDIPAGRHQPFYVTVQTTAKDTPGEYQGYVKVSAENAPTTLIPLAVKVYNITLPVKSHLRTAFALWGYFNQYDPTLKDDRKRFVDTYISWAKLMLSYRISPIAMWRPAKKADGSYDFSELDRLCEELIPLGLNTLNIGENWQMAINADTEWAKASEKHFKEKGWWDLHYVYGVDEASPGAAGMLVNNYGALVKAVPDLKVMQTGWNPNPQLKGLVKIWCPMLADANLDAIHAGQKDGDEVWWYECCVPVKPYPNFFIDYPGIDQRMLGWLSYKSGIQGFAYWAVDLYVENKEPLEKYVDANFANWQTCSFDNKNADGILIYPGKNSTPIPSFRLALLRDGVEDYDLFTEVKSLAEKGGPVGEKASRLLQLNHPIIDSLKEYTQKGSDLIARREAILKAGEMLAETKR